MRIWIGLLLLGFACNAVAQQAGDVPPQYHWRVAGTVHGAAFTGEAWVREAESTWEMDIEIEGGNHLTVKGESTPAENGGVKFLTKYATTDVVLEPVPGILNNLPGPFGSHRWQQRAGTADIQFTTIEPITLAPGTTTTTEPGP